MLHKMPQAQGDDHNARAAACEWFTIITKAFSSGLYIYIYIIAAINTADSQADDFMQPRMILGEMQRIAFRLMLLSCV